MTQIKFNYPAMLAHAESMHAHAATLDAIGSGIAATQGTLAGTFQGDTGEAYQAVQARYNAAHQELVSSYRALANIHQDNTMTMLGRDTAEGAKWV